MKVPSFCLLTLLRISRRSRLAVLLCSLLILLARVDSQLLLQIQGPFSSSDDPFHHLGPDEDDDGLHVYAAKAGWSAFEEELRSHSSTVLGAPSPSDLSFEARIPVISPAAAPSLECQCRLSIGSLLTC